MKLTFDPNNPEEREKALHAINFFATPPTVTGPTDPVVTGGNIREVLASEPSTVVIVEPEITAQAGVELDVNGTPWIAEVHASTKSKTAAKRWTKRRGTTDEALDAAETAARAKIAGTPEAPDLPAVEVQAETVDPITMAQLIDKYSETMKAGLITPEGFSGLYTEYNTSAADLDTNETARSNLYMHLIDLESEPAAISTGLPG